MRSSGPIPGRIQAGTYRTTYVLGKMKISEDKGHSHTDKSSLAFTRIFPNIKDSLKLVAMYSSYRVGRKSEGQVVRHSFITDFKSMYGETDSSPYRTLG